MARTATTIGFSVTPELAADIERMATVAGISKSQLFREMVRVYKREHELQVFEELGEYGSKRARERSIRTEEDVERLIHESRGA
jgi:hypothetical protein